jgi:hypothetical protein
MKLNLIISLYLSISVFGTNEISMPCRNESGQ